MASVRYLFGSQAGYDNLAVKDQYAFYKTPTNLYLGDMKLSNAADVEAALAKIGDLSQLNTTTKVSLVDAINEVLASGGTGVSAATDSQAGIMLLYKQTGDHEDGTMTQKAITDSLKGFEFVAIDTDDNGEVDCLHLKTPFDIHS